MWKKIIIGILVIATIFINVPISYAAGSNYSRRSTSVKISATDDSKYQVLSPDKDVFRTSDKFILVSGRAPQGTNVTIEVFGTTDMTRNNFNLDNLPGEKDYIRRYKEIIKVNGYTFGKNFDLIAGVNKIVVTFRNDDDEVIEQKIIYVSDLSQVKKSVSGIKEDKTINTMINNAK